MFSFTKIPLFIYVIATVIFISIMAGFVFLLVEGKNTDPLVNFLTQQLVPALASAIGLANFSKLQKVQEQTNGTATTLTSINAAQSAALATSVPATSVLIPPTVVPPTVVPPAPIAGAELLGTPALRPPVVA